LAPSRRSRTREIAEDYSRRLRASQEELRLAREEAQREREQREAEGERERLERERKSSEETERLQREINRREQERLAHEQQMKTEAERTKREKVSMEEEKRRLEQELAAIRQERSVLHSSLEHTTKQQETELNTLRQQLASERALLQKTEQERGQLRSSLEQVQTSASQQLNQAQQTLLQQQSSLQATGANLQESQNVITQMQSELSTKQGTIDQLTQVLHHLQQQTQQIEQYRKHAEEKETQNQQLMQMVQQLQQPQLPQNIIPPLSQEQYLQKLGVNPPSSVPSSVSSTSSSHALPEGLPPVPDYRTEVPEYGPGIREDTTTPHWTENQVVENNQPYVDALDKFFNANKHRFNLSDAHPIESQVEIIELLDKVRNHPDIFSDQALKDFVASAPVSQMLNAIDQMSAGEHESAVRRWMEAAYALGEEEGGKEEEWELSDLGITEEEQGLVGSAIGGLNRAYKNQKNRDPKFDKNGLFGKVLNDAERIAAAQDLDQLEAANYARKLPSYKTTGDFRYYVRNALTKLQPESGLSKETINKLVGILGEGRRLRPEKTAKRTK